MSDTALKTCPSCKEKIRSEAVKCRFCGEWLEETVPPPEASQPNYEEFMTPRPHTQHQSIGNSLPQTGAPSIQVPPELHTTPSPCHQRESPILSENQEIVVDPLPKRAHYFVRHWRGDLSLGISYWVNGLLVTLIVALASQIIGTFENTVSLKVIAVSTISLYALVLLATVWQLIGIWRSASNHTSRGGSSIWAILAKAAVIFAWLTTGAAVVKNYIPQSLELARIVAGDTSLPPFKITVLPGGNEVEFRGGIRAGAARELERVLAAVPQATVLHIESTGGRITEAEKMAGLVRDRGLTTYSSEYCMSAATHILIAGKERVVGKASRIGFHAGSLPGATIEQARDMNDLTRKTMRESGVSEHFIDRVLATPSDQMWYPSFAEMKQAGVVTSESFGDRFAVAGAAASPDRTGNESAPKITSAQTFSPKALRSESLSKAYGYLVAQDASIDLIDSAFPNLSEATTEARSTFAASALGKGRQALEQELALTVGPEWRKTAADIRNSLAGSVKRQTLTVEQATNYLAEIKARAKGNLPASIKSTLLSVHPDFSQNPALELAAGWQQTFRTKDHSKAKGADFSVSIPASWRMEEGKRPNVIQLFRSLDGHGPAMCMLLVYDLPQQVTAAETKSMLQPDQLKDYIPEGAKIIDSQTIVLESLPAGMVIFEHTQQRLDVSFSIRSTEFILAHRRWLVLITCQVTALPDSEQTLTELHQQFMPLFKSIANSLVLNDKYN